MEVKFTLDRETKNTIRYAEVVPDGETPVIGTLYIQKSALGADRPKEVTVKIDW